MIRIQPSCFRSLFGHCKAAAALEFAIVAPMLMIMLLGVVEVTLMIRADMKLSFASWALGDIVAQQSSGMTKAKLSEYCGGASSMMSPFPIGQFYAGVASVSVTGVNWNSKTASCAAGGTSAGGLAPVSATVLVAARNLAPADGSAIVAVDTTYQYQPFFTLFVNHSLSFTRTVFVRARSNSTIPCGTC